MHACYRIRRHGKSDQPITAPDKITDLSDLPCEEGEEDRAEDQRVEETLVVVGAKPMQAVQQPLGGVSAAH